MTAAEHSITDMMKWLAEDLYRERRHRGGYAMENPPGTVRVEFEPLSEVAVRAVVKFQGSLGQKGVLVHANPSTDWLDEVLP